MREILNRSFDARQVPSILARPSGGIGEAVVVRSEIDQLIMDVLDKVAQLRADAQQADATDTANWADALNTLQTTVNQALDGVKAKYAVAAAVDSLAEINAALPGLDPTAADWHSWILVKGSTLAENGVYRIQGGTPLRVPKFANADSLQAGVLFFDNHSNIHYVVSEDAATVSGTNPAVGSVELLPYSRAEQINGSGFLSVVANQINATLDGDFLEVVGGQLTLTAAFRQQIEELVESAADQEQALANLSTGLADITSRVAQLNVAIDNAQTALATHTSQIAALQQSDTAQTTRLTAAEGTLTSQGNRISQLETSDGEQQQAISNLETGQTIQNQQLTQHETTLQGHTQQLASQQQSINSAQASITDAQASIVVHGQQLTQLDTELDGKLNTADLDAAQEAKLATLVKSFRLTNGITERRVDTDDNTEYYFTTFEQSTGWGHLHFRGFDLSDTLSPYTKRGYSFTFQRVGVDSFKIIFQSSLSAFPSDQVDIAVIRIPGAVSNQPQPTQSQQQTAPQQPTYNAVISRSSMSISNNVQYGITVNGITGSVGFQWMKNGQPVGNPGTIDASFFNGAEYYGSRDFDNIDQFQSGIDEIGAGEWWMHFEQGTTSFDSNHVVLTGADPTIADTLLLLGEGNSLMAGDYGSLGSYLQRVNDQIRSLVNYPIKFLNFAYPGLTTPQVRQRNLGTRFSSDRYRKSIVIVQEVTNHMHGGATPQQAFDLIVEECKSIKSKGSKVRTVLVAATPRNGIAGLPLPATYNAEAFNNLVRQAIATPEGKAATGIDAFADIAAIPEIGGSGAQNNTQYYTDGIHFYTEASYQLIVPVVSAAISSLL